MVVFMEADIRTFIKGIKDKTGIELGVFDSNGHYIAGNENLIQSISTDFEDLYQDEEKNITLFTIKYKGNDLIGCIQGASLVERNYSVLVGELAQKSNFKEVELSRSEFCKAILQSEVNYSQVVRYQKKYNMQDTPAFVLIVATETKFNDIISVLKNYSEGRADFISRIGENQIVFVKFIDETNNEYQSSTEYAEFLKMSVYEETGVQVKIFVGGTVKTLVDLASSYNQANTALRMSNAIDAKGEIHSFKEYILIRMLEEMPKFKLNEYLETLMDTDAKDIFSDEEMIDTAEEFLENSLNISETARKLYLHRNTLTYRLDKIERSTGLNIRKFADAITFRLITILSKLVK